MRASSRFISFLAAVLSMFVGTAPAVAQVSVLAQQVEELNLAQRKLAGDRPAVRQLKERAVGERDRRAALRLKKTRYTGGLPERVGELKFHRQERLERRKAKL